MACSDPIQRIVPFHLKKIEHAADIFRGMWPTTVLLRTTATANGSSVLILLAHTCNLTLLQQMGSKCCCKYGGLEQNSRSDTSPFLTATS